MSEIIDTLQQPFMLRALYAGLLIAISTSILGVFVTLKKESFLSDGIAHASLSGVAFGLLIADAPLVFGLISAIVMASLISYTKNKKLLPSDTAIGIVFTTLFALGLLLLFFQDSYTSILETYLFGNIVLVTWDQILYSGLLLLAILIIVNLIYKELLMITLDPEFAKVRNIKVERIEYIYQILTALTIVLSIKMVGVVLVAALLIIPATNARIFAKRFSQMITLTLAFSLTSLIVGIVISINYPPGPIIVLTSSTLLFVSFIVQKIFKL